MSVGDLYEAIVDDEAYAALPATLARLLGARSGLVHQLGASEELVGMSFSYFTTEMTSDFARVHPDGGDVWTGTALARGLFERALVLDDIVSSEDFARSLLWNEVFRPHGDDTGHAMGLIHRLDGATMCISLHRAEGAGAFGRADAARLDALSGDLHRIHRARMLLRMQGERIARLDHLLDTARAAVLLVDGDLRLVEASPAARALIDARDGIALRGGRITLPDETLTAALREAARCAIQRRPIARAAFICRRVGPALPWRLLVLPLAGAAAATCAIVIGGGDVPTDRMQLWLREHHGATVAETAVAAALLAGRSPEEIGRMRGVSINTVRTQIRHLIDKTGASGIGTLLVLLARSC